MRCPRFGCSSLWPVMWWHKRDLLGESSMGHNPMWAQVIKMAATEEDARTFVFVYFWTTSQTLIMFCYLICCRWYFSHFQLNCITVSMICWGSGLPRALSTILKWDGPRFFARRFGASPGHWPFGNQLQSRKASISVRQVSQNYRKGSIRTKPVDLIRFHQKC